MTSSRSRAKPKGIVVTPSDRDSRPDYCFTNPVRLVFFSALCHARKFTRGVACAPCRWAWLGITAAESATTAVTSRFPTPPDKELFLGGMGTCVAALCGKKKRGGLRLVDISQTP